MTLALALGALAGMAIGLRRKVLMIVPAILIAAIGAIMISHERESWEIVAAVVLSALTVQLGYLCGSLAVSLFRDEPVPATADQPARFTAHPRPIE